MGVGAACRGAAWGMAPSGPGFCLRASAWVVLPCGIASSHGQAAGRGTGRKQRREIPGSRDLEPRR